MHPTCLRRTVVAFVALAAAVAIPAATSAQTPFRAACDLLEDSAVSGILGLDVTAERQGSRTMCFYEDAEQGPAGSILLLSDVDLSLFAAQEGSEPISVAGVEGVASPFGQEGRIVLALPEGGLLDLTVDPPPVPEAYDARALATSLAEAILAAGPVTAIPADRGEAEALFVVTTLCDAITVEQVNEITGGGVGSPDGNEEGRCFYPATEGCGGITTGLFEDDEAVNAGTYTSEEITVAGRPASWDPRFGWLDVDAGTGRRLHVNTGDYDPEDPAIRDQPVAIAEAIIPNLTPAAPPPPPPPAECDAPLEDLSRITGLEITTAASFGPLCFYTAEGGTTMSGVLAGFLPGDDPASALEAAEFTSEVAPTPGEVDGHAALIAESPEGTAVAVDLDGLPNGDGQVLLVAVGGLPEGTDRLAAATEVVRLFISQM
jgi:hypothetical protein